MDGTIILIIVATIMFAVIGGVTLASHIYNLNSIKSKTVGDGQHGTARFSTNSELRRIYKYIPYEPKVWRKIAKQENLNLPQGVILGVKKKNGIDYAMVDDDDVHTLMIGAAGCGKTAFWLYPNLEYACAAGMSFLTTDTKRFNKEQRSYVWADQTKGYYTKPKEDWLKKHGYWDEVLDRYLYKKNTNEGLVKKSRALYAEAINEIYMKHRA